MSPFVLLALVSLLGLMFFADGPNGSIGTAGVPGTPGDGAGAPSPAAPPPGSPPGPGTPGTPPPSGEPPAQGRFTVDTDVTVRTLSGETKTIKVGEMLKAWQTQPDAGTLEKVALFEQAVSKGDYAAAQQLLAKISPPPVPATPPGTPAAAQSPTEKAMQDRLDALEKMLQTKIGPTVDSIREAGTIQQASTFITANKDKHPILSARQDGAAMVTKYVRNFAKNSGVDFDALSPELRSQAIAVAAPEVEANLLAFFKASGFDPAMLAAGAGSGSSNGRNIMAIDDQNRTGDHPPNMIPARFRVDPATGQLVPNTPPPVSTLPAVPINGAPGGAPGAAPPVTGGRMTPDQMIQKMRAQRGANV